MNLKKLSVVILCCINISAFTIDFTSGFSDIDCLNQFHIRQDNLLRVFHVVEDENYYGCIVSSSFGKFDFYDNKKEKKYENIYDDLFDDFEKIGSIKFLYDADWNWITRPKKLEIFSKENIHLATLRSEGDNYTFVFRDADTNKALAVAILNWNSIKNICNSGMCIL
jgi:hypothetical protein